MCYLSKLEDPKKVIEIQGVTPAFTYLNQEFLGDIIDGVIRIDFNSLYANLLIMFYDNKILEKFNIEIDTEDINKIKYYQSNRGFIKQNNIEEYHKLKYEINMIFSTRSSDNNYFYLRSLINQYTKLFYTDFVNDNSYSCLYIDTDCIFVADKFENVKSLDKMKVTYEYVNMQLFSYSRMKRWIAFSNDEDGYTEIKKYGYNNPYKQYNCEEVISQMKNILRNKKLEKLLKEDN